VEDGALESESFILRLPVLHGDVILAMARDFQAQLARQIPHDGRPVLKLAGRAAALDVLAQSNGVGAFLGS
jgi:hypothetical protein